MDVAMGTALAAAANNNAVGAVIPLSSTEDKDAYVGAFTDSTALLGNDNNVESVTGKGSSGGSSAPWGTRTLGAPIDSIVAGDAIVVATLVVLVIVSCDMAVEGGVSGAVPPLSLSSLTSAVAALYLIPPLNVHR